MMRYIVILFLSVFFLSIAYPANDNMSSDAPSQGLGGVSVVGNSLYSSFNNQSALTFVQTPSLVCSYSDHFLMYDARVAAVLPTAVGLFGGSVTRFGSSLYHEVKMGLFYSRTFGDNFSVSIQPDLLSATPSSNRTMYAFTAELGIWARPIENLSIGFHVYNFINTNYKTDYYDEDVPVNMKLGIAYSILDNFYMLSELEISSIYGTSVHGGLSYNIHQNVIVRAGAASNPSLASLGLGVRVKKIQIDMACQAVRYLGKKGSVSLSYTF